MIYYQVDSEFTVVNKGFTAKSNGLSKLKNVKPVSSGKIR